MTSASAAIGIKEISEAYGRISSFIHRTPVLTCETLNKLAGDKQLFFKCENLQKTGAFKARGALNGIRLALERDPSVSGIVTHSSGNHGQAVAWASSVVKLPCTVVVPKGTPQVKCDAILGYGADLVFCDPTPTSRHDTCARIAAETGRIVIHPYDNTDVIAGQGTIGLELHEQVPDLDAVLVPISGGGMTSGIALATRDIRGDTCKVIAVEPKGKNLGDCLRAKSRLWPNPPQFLDTIAEGIKTQQLGQITFPIICETVQDVITVTDDDMIQGMKLVFGRMKLVIESAAGASVAAAISSQLKEKYPELKKIGVILCGGNIDIENLPWNKQ